MADITQIRILKKGRRAWNSWRRKKPKVPPDLTDTVIKSWIDNLCFPYTSDDGFADERYNLSKASFKGTRFIKCKLIGSDFTESDLTGSIFENCDLSDCDFSETVWSKTMLINCILNRAKGLGSAKHFSSSVLDHMTLTLNPHLNVNFLRGVGLSDTMIEYLSSLTAQPIEFYSCFISYSAMNEKFVKRLHADLQDNGVRCWYAPKNMKIGDKIRDTIDQAIRVREKLLLVLSLDSINSPWVEKEVETAFEEENRNKKIILFPIMIDNYLFETEKSWAADIRRTRHVGDFIKWKYLDSYTDSFNRLLRDLKQSAENDYY